MKLCCHKFGRPYIVGSLNYILNIFNFKIKLCWHKFGGSCIVDSLDSWGMDSIKV